MSVIATIPINPQGSRVRYPVRRFSAPFALGAYDFNQPGNTDVLLYKLSPSSVYLMERINFSGNIAEADWLQGMDTQANFPSFVVNRKSDRSASLFAEPVQCVNYVDNAEQLVFFRTDRKADELLITFSGKVNQVAGSVGVDPLLAQVNFTMYEITDSAWIRTFIEGNQK